MSRSCFARQRFPTHLAFDSFDRADSASSLGATDGKTNGFGTLEPLTWTQHAGVWGISSLRAKEITDVGTNYATVDLGVSDVDLTLRPAQTGGGQIGILFRYTDTTHWWRFIDNGGAMQLTKLNGATHTVVDQGTHTRGVGDVMRVIAIGSTISCYVNGVLLASASDSFNVSATRCGMVVTSANTFINNFSAARP